MMISTILPRYANKLTWFRLSANQIVGFLIGSMPKPCLVPAPTTVKLPHASGHSSGNRQDHVTKTKRIASKFSWPLILQMCNFFWIHSITCTYFRIIIHSTAYHHLQITRLSYFGNENQGLPLRSWLLACWLWRHIPIVTSLAVPSSCVVTQTPMGTNSGTRRWKRKFPLLFVKLWSW